MKDQVILITGAAKGIGLATARLLLEHGVRVALNDLTPKAVEGARDCLPLSQKERTLGCPGDVRKPADVEMMVACVLEQWGQIDGVVNNAGVYPSHEVIEMSEADWDRVMDTNAKGTFLVSQAVARQMIAKKIRGDIINIASGSYQSARVGSAHYCASKAAVVMFTKVLAQELGPYGIRVNAIAPGLIQVESLALNPSYIESTLKQVPAGRLGKPEDIAEVVLSLLEMRTDYVTGAVIAVDGGLALGRFGIPRS